jgi:hypothetical protein
MALALAGGTTTILAFVEQGKAEEFFDGMAKTSPDIDTTNTAISRRDDYVTASAILYGGAVALGVTGLILFLVDTPRVEAPPSAPAVIPTVTPDGDVGVTWATPF